MDGILVIDKPAGITSHDVVARVRKILKIKRVGHTGTLDPFATGVLVVLTGKATRLAQFLDKDEKEYEAVIRFGFETETGDATGVRREASAVQTDEEAARILGETKWDKVPGMFLGEIDGKKLYEHARKGKPVERKPATVLVRELEITDRTDLGAPNFALRIRVACSAGTYVRVLAEDIGRAVGVGAHLTGLRRTRAGRFDLQRSITLDALAEMEEPASALLPMQLAVEHLAEFRLTDDRVDKTRSGLATRVFGSAFADRQAVRMHAPTGDLIAIGIYDHAEEAIRPRVVLI